MTWYAQRVFPTPYQWRRVLHRRRRGGRADGRRQAARRPARGRARAGRASTRSRCSRSASSCRRSGGRSARAHGLPGVPRDLRITSVIASPISGSATRARARRRARCRRRRARRSRRRAHVVARRPHERLELAPPAVAVVSARDEHVRRERREARRDRPDVEVVDARDAGRLRQRTLDCACVDAARGGLEQNGDGVAEHAPGARRARAARPRSQISGSAYAQPFVRITSAPRTRPNEPSRSAMSWRKAAGR